MKIASSFLPLTVKQPPPRVDESSAQQPKQQHTGENSNDTSRLIIGDVETVLEQAQARREIIDLRALKEAPLPFNNLRALSSYQTIASGQDEATSGLARLDIIV